MLLRQMMAIQVEMPFDLPPLFPLWMWMIFSAVALCIQLFVSFSRSVQLDEKPLLRTVGLVIEKISFVVPPQLSWRMLMMEHLLLLHMMWTCRCLSFPHHEVVVCEVLRAWMTT